jgi:hypothetical protein
LSVEDQIAGLLVPEWASGGESRGQLNNIKSKTSFPGFDQEEGQIETLSDI